MLLLNDPTGDVWVDAATKGIPAGSGPVRLSEIGVQGWNVLAGDCPLPLAVIRTDIMEANSAWMMAFVRQHGLLLAPHGRQPWRPLWFARQLADGAWGNDRRNHTADGGLRAGGVAADRACQSADRQGGGGLLPRSAVSSGSGAVRAG